ncbi:ABC transporter ATP-binding protein, partial [Klebsiella oxytoca]
AAVAFVILARINVLLTVIIFVLIPVMAVSCSYFNVQVRKAFRSQRNHIGELNARIEDSLLGNKVVRAFANEKVEL